MTEFNKDDFMENAQGMLVPKSQIKPIDLLRNDVVNNLIAKAKVQSEQIKSFIRRWGKQTRMPLIKTPTLRPEKKVRTLTQKRLKR